MKLSILTFCTLGLALCVIAVILQYATDDEIATHSLWCSSNRVDGICNDTVTPLSRDFYKALPNQQAVLYWNESDPIVHRFAFCAVRDIGNWTCSENKIGEIPAVEYQMVNGGLRKWDGELEANPIINNTIKAQEKYLQAFEVSRLRWWEVWLTQYLAMHSKRPLP